MTHTLVAFGIVATLGGCMERDPYRRTDVWRPTGSNAANIAAQVANPNDLIRGQGAQRSDTMGSTVGIGRIWANQPRPLPAAGTGGAGGGQSGN